MPISVSWSSHFARLRRLSRVFGNLSGFSGPCRDRHILVSIIRWGLRRIGWRGGRCAPVRRRPLGPPLLGRPLQFEPSVVQRTVSQVEVDQVLIRHSQFGGHSLEIRHGCLVKSDRDRSLQMLSVRVLLPTHLREVVMRPHGVTSSRQSLPSRLPSALR